MVRRKTLTKQSLLIALAAGVVIVGLGAFIYHERYTTKPTKAQTSVTRPENSVSYAPSTKSDNAENNSRKSSSSPATTLNNGPTASSGSASPASFSAQIVSSTVSGSNVHVGTLVSGTTSGTCTLTATQSGQQTVTLTTAQVRQDVNNYDCGPINIATTQFPASGTWKLTLTVSSNGQQASDSADVTISGS